MMEYKGYRAAVTFDDEADAFHGEVVDTRDVIVFEGASVAQLRKEFKFSIDDYLEACAERRRTPDKPFSVRIRLRISPEVLMAAAIAARMQGKSLNAWIAEAVEEAVEKSGDVVD